MTAASVHPGPLATLLALPEAHRADWLRASANADSLLLGASDEAERLVVSDLTQAVARTNMLVALSDQVGSTAGGARARRALAQALAYSNRFDEALEALSRAIQQAESIGDALEAARARMTSLHALARQGRYDEAITAGLEARAAFVAAGEPILAARADINLGGSYRLKGDARTAIAHFEAARPAVLDQPLLRAPLASNLAEAYLDLDRFDDADAAFREALSAFESAGANRAAAIVEGNLADLSTRQGRLDRALRYFEHARRRLGELDAPGDVARLKVEHADAMSALGLRAQAIGVYQEAIPVLHERKMAWEAARGLMGLARALFHCGRVDEASATLSEASSAFESLGHDLGIARVRMLQAELAAHRGQTDAARELITSSAVLLTDRPAEMSLVSLLLAQLALRSGDLQTAGLEIARGLSTAQAMELAPLCAELFHARALLRRASGDFSAAAEDLRRAIAQVERIRGMLQADRFRAAFLGDRASLYEDCLAAVLEAGAPDAISEAFQIAERSKSRTLLDVLQRGEGLSDASPGEAADPAEDRLIDDLLRKRGELSAMYAQLDGTFSLRKAGRSMSDWTIAVREREREIDAIEHRLAATRSYADVFGEPATLPTVADLLRAGEVMVEYVSEGHWLSALVVRRDGSSVHRRLAPMEDVRDRTERVYFEIGRAISRGVPSGAAGLRLLNGARAEFGALYDALYRPLASDLADARRLVIVPHGALHAIPFSALWSGDRWLIQDREIVQTPSASIFARISSAKRSANLPGGALVIGVGDSLAPGAEEEARAVASRIPRAKLLVGEEATVSAVFAACRNVGVLHIASHARFIPAEPLSSGLKLADGWLTARDVHRLGLDGTIVTLSGCDTGRSAVGSSDELIGLVRAFLASGASALLLSLWPLHDRSALTVMSAAYAQTSVSATEVRGGLVSSVRNAQLALLADTPHPAFWAPFTWIGVP